MKKKTTYMLSFIFLVFGLLLLVNSQANITGAVIGASKTPSGAGFFAGASLILVSFILFAVSTGNLEKKIKKFKVINRIGDFGSFRRSSKKARRNRQVNTDLNNFYDQLEENGYLQGGIGKHFLKDTKGIFALRSKDGARLYCRKIPGGYEVLAESSKQNQDKVIKALKEIYH